MSYITTALIDSLRVTVDAQANLENLGGNFWVNLIHAITHQEDTYIGQPHREDDESVIKARFEAIEADIEKALGVKASTINPYRSAKSVINSAVKLGIDVNVRDDGGLLAYDAKTGMPFTRGKSEIQKAIKEAKERKSDAIRIAEHIEQAMKILNSDTREPISAESLAALKDAAAQLFARIDDESGLHALAA